MECSQNPIGFKRLVFAVAQDCKKWQKIILKYHKYLGEFFQKKYVCTRTRTHIVLIALKFA